MLRWLGDKVLTRCCRSAWAGALGVLVSACVYSACATGARPAHLRGAVQQEGAPKSQNESDAALPSESLSQSASPQVRGRTLPPASKLPPRKPTKVVNVTPQDIEQAKKLLDRGLLAYQKGDYDSAEAALAQSMALYPFLAEAHLTLGKIYLMRGSANRDQTMIDHARLMFQMAHAVDPNLRETDLLLQLFLAEPLP